MIHDLLAGPFASVLTALILAGLAAPVSGTPTKNVVLVHGVFVGGSGWKLVSDILTRNGYRVWVVQQSSTALEEMSPLPDASSIVNQAAVFLIGHSYGGAIITESRHEFACHGSRY